MCLSFITICYAKWRNPRASSSYAKRSDSMCLQLHHYLEEWGNPRASSSYAKRTPSAANFITIYEEWRNPSLFLHLEKPVCLQPNHNTQGMEKPKCLLLL